MKRRSLLVMATVAGGSLVTGCTSPARQQLRRGALTSKQGQVALNGWDLSVLQRPYNALRSDGAMWKATEALVNEASTGVVTIRDLQSMMGAGQKNALLERLRQMAINRSIVKDVVLNGGRGPNNEGKEEYHREPVQFAGFKIFYKNDMKPPSDRLLTPGDLLKLTPRPIFIQYQ